MSVVSDFVANIDSNDLSEWLISLDLSQDPEMHDDTRMSSTTDTRASDAGLIVGTLTCTFKQIYASVDAVLAPLVKAAAFPVIVSPASGAVGASNPYRTGDMVISSYNPLSGTVGDHDVCTVVFASAGTMTRTVV
jgi:hypothetical protein